MEAKESKYCAYCGKEIGKSYLKILDNYLMIKYFDNDEDNCFCSAECLMNSLFVREIYLDEEEDI